MFYQDSETSLLSWTSRREAWAEKKRLILNGIPDLVKIALTSELPLSHAEIKLKIKKKKKAPSHGFVSFH